MQADEILRPEPLTGELAERVGQLPQLYDNGSKSTAALLREAGYPEKRQALTVEAVERVLVRQPRLADLWLRRSNDQRISGGWGIDRAAGLYRVQNFADGQSLLVRDRPRACAEFVVRYVTFIGDVLARWR